MKTAAIVLVLALAGCTVIHGDEFTQDEGCDLELHLRGFSPHVTDMTSVLLNRARRDGTMRRIEAVAVFDPLGTVDLDLRMPGSVRPRTSVEQGLAAVDFFADFDDVEGFSFPGDHSWVLEDVCTTGPEEFAHNTDFVGIRAPEGFGTTVAARFCGVTTVADSAIEMRVTRTLDEDAIQAIGLYRLDDIERRADGIGIPFIANVDFDMTVEVIADRNRDGAFDPPGDDAWSYAHRGDAQVPCSALPLDRSGCPNATTVLREPLPACVTDSGDLLVVLSPVTNANRTSTLSSRDPWVRFSR
jgi:hypothetical protein